MTKFAPGWEREAAVRAVAGHMGAIGGVGAWCSSPALFDLLEGLGRDLWPSVWCMDN